MIKKEKILEKKIEWIKQKEALLQKQQDKLAEEKHQMEWIIQAKVAQKISDLENKFFSERPTLTFYS